MQDECCSFLCGARVTRASSPGTQRERRGSGASPCDPRLAASAPCRPRPRPSCAPPPAWRPPRPARKRPPRRLLRSRRKCSRGLKEGGERSCERQSAGHTDGMIGASREEEDSAATQQRASLLPRDAPAGRAKRARPAIFSRRDDTRSTSRYPRPSQPRRKLHAPDAMLARPRPSGPRLGPRFPALARA